MGGPGSGRKAGSGKGASKKGGYVKSPRSMGQKNGFKNKTGSSRPAGRKPKGV